MALLVKLRPLGVRGGRPEQRALAVSTTHLLYNPRRDDVRLAQAVLMMAGKLTISF